MILLIAVVALPPSLQAQQLNMRSSFMLRGTITTSSRVFNNPDAQDIIDRDHYDFVDDLVGGGIQYRLEFTDQNVLLTFSVEYVTRILAQTVPFLTTTNQIVSLPVRQGVRFIPVEVGVNTHVPLIADLFRLTMGGGFGMYYADRVYSISGNDMKTETLPIGYGIHVETGLDYRIYKNIGISWEMRFRDPEITNEGSFGADRISVGNNQISVANIPPRTKINVHGVSFTLGVLLGFD